MSETPGRGRHVPRPDREPRGGYDPSGREPRDRRPDDREPYDQDQGAGREARPHDRPHDESREQHDARGAREPQEAETRRGGQEGGEGAPDALQDRVVELQALVTDLQDRWRRALADLDNLRKRVSRDAQRTQAEERARAAVEWLPVLDNLDRALEHAEADSASMADMADGMRAIRDQAQEVLSRLGYARRDDTGAVFDPARHEAVGVLSQEGVPDGTVLRVVRPGYGDGEQQLRPALVVVAKGA
ncbi:nucleotide exchange factor GrpE [Streptosporangium sp. G11]|uniref:nucleotide exchange factor GrpE n=1 Tax=Streptosporangium sp. G11 TaxID=3436926 RepID=UPI003EB717FA